MEALKAGGRPSKATAPLTADDLVGLFRVVPCRSRGSPGADQTVAVLSHTNAADAAAPSRSPCSVPPSRRESPPEHSPAGVRLPGMTQGGHLPCVPTLVLQTARFYWK